MRSRLRKGEILLAEDVQGIYGSSHLVTANLFLQAAANGGKGGVMCLVLEGQGLNDADDPWSSPRGNLFIKVWVAWA